MKNIDINEKQKVQYCIPLWLRDEQIKLAIQRKDVGRFVPYPEGQKRNDLVAVVCYGPSLNDTWEKIKDFKYIITCSGSHKFLLERGIMPTWHVEVDPREHKVKLIGKPSNDTEYLIASTCHPKLFDHLSSYNVKLWHVFDSEEEALRVLPSGEWAVTGGPNVGLRAMGLARLLGFTNLHIFGMDGNEGKTGKHAAEHPNQPSGHGIVSYGGVEYKTTTSMAECARQTWHELDQMTDVIATFHGDGLVQAMAKEYKRKTDGKNVLPLALIKPETISAEYRRLNRQLHETNLAYGVGGGKYAQDIIKIAEKIKTTSVLDYGCGKGYLAKEIPFPIWEYDPAIPGKDVTPRPADIVVCTDVLEHIEPDKLDYVLLDLARCTRQIGYYVIHTGPSAKLLADGRNAHLIQKDKEWWIKKLSKLFIIGQCLEQTPLIRFIVAPKELRKQNLIAAEAIR